MTWKIAVALVLICGLLTLASREVLAMPVILDSEFDESVLALKPVFEGAIRRYGILYRSFIYATRIDHIGVGVSYCFEFHAEKSSQYEVVRQMIAKYPGKFNWQWRPDFNNKGGCIAFMPTEEIAEFFTGETTRLISLEDVSSDARQLCAFLELQTTSAPPVMNSGEVDDRPPDLYAPGMHEIYVLRNPERGLHSGMSTTDRMLHFAPTNHEWNYVLSLVLGIPADSPRLQSLEDVTFPNADYPLISRITSPYREATYSFSEIAELSSECQRLLKATQVGPARDALQKVSLATQWATRLKSGLLFEPKD